MDIYFRVAFKPVATIVAAQATVNSKGEETTVEGKGRHDPCVVPRAVPIVEAMAALTPVSTGRTPRGLAKVPDEIVMRANRILNSLMTAPHCLGHGLCCLFLGSRCLAAKSEVFREHQFQAIADAPVHFFRPISVSS